VELYWIEGYSNDVPDRVKRPYVSPQRDAQARATRQSILDAALRLFTTSGYVGTTIQSVADEAGVAVQTVYATFGNKRELLRRTLEAAVSGGPDDVPLSEQAAVQAMADERDPRRRAELDAAFSTRISQRVAPIMQVLREAASADPEFAATAEEITARRRADMVAAVDLLAEPDGAERDVEELVGTLYVLYSPDVFLALTGDLGWSAERYERWLAEMLYRTVIT
jgi:AcrR family transcriptional regulator